MADMPYNAIAVTRRGQATFKCDFCHKIKDFMDVVPIGPNEEYADYFACPDCVEKTDHQVSVSE